ncbi:MAG: hypothetical protein J5J00_17285, partial [Deltaproteobacteria bacterium]|nr:hypothetical protein [Deltaproteobacteria bacterium]
MSPHFTNNRSRKEHSMKCSNIAVGLLLLGIVSPADAALISVRDTLGGATVVDGASITDFGAGNDWGTAASKAEPPAGSTFASATFRIGGLQPGLTFPFTSVSQFDPFSWTFFLGSELELSANPRLLDTGPMDHVFTEAEGLQLSIFGTFPDFYAEVSAFPGSDFLLPPDTRFALKAEAASASL